MMRGPLIDTDHLPEPRDVPLLEAIAKTGGYALDRTSENGEGIDRLKAKQLVTGTTNSQGERVWITRGGELCLIQLTGSCPAKEEPEDMSPYLLDFMPHAERTKDPC